MRKTRWLVALVVASLTLVLAGTAQAAPAEFVVLVFTGNDGSQAANVDAGVKEIRKLAREQNFNIVVTDRTREFDKHRLQRYDAVLFLNTNGSPLGPNEEAAFEAWFRAGGGFMGVNSAIETEPGVAVPDRHPRRARVGPDRRPARHRQGRRPRPRREQEPARVLGPHRALVQLHGQRPRHQPRPRDGRRAAVRQAARLPDAERDQRHDGRRPSGRLVQGLPGRPLVLHLARASSPASYDAELGEHLVRSPALDGRRRRPRLQRLRRHRARQLPDELRGGSAEPERADRLRRPARRQRPRHPDRPPRRRPPPRPRHQHDDAAGQHPRLHRQRGRHVRPGGRQQLQHEQVGVPLLLAAHRREREAVRRLEGDDHDPAERPDDAAERAERAELRLVAQRLGSVRRLLPAVALQVRRGDGDDAGPPRSRQRAADPPRRQQPRCLLPRRRRHRLRLPQQPVDGHG